MKSRLFALLTALTLAVTLAACGDSAKEAADKAAAATKEAVEWPLRPQLPFLEPSC